MRYQAAVITVSDKGSRGERVDTSGPALVEMLKEADYDVVYTTIVPDERDQIREELLKCADEKHLALILTTGGTGFSPRDITPEATLEVLERLTPGIPEAMRAESMKITPHGCLSRETAGIRGRSLIINLPGSKKASTENFAAVIKAVKHGVDMLHSEGSADCGEEIKNKGISAAAPVPVKAQAPSMDAWLKEAKQAPDAGRVGMYLVHNGVVRSTAKAKVRGGDAEAADVAGMNFSWNPEKVQAAEQEALKLEGIYYVRTWLNSGELKVGDDIMFVLIGGDIRPHVVDALQFLVGKIKSECVTEQEIHG